MKIYQRIINPGRIKTKYFFGLFKTIKMGYDTKFYFLGVNFLKKTNRIQAILNNTNILRKEVDILKREISYLKIKHQMSLAVAKEHSKVFPQFKNIHKDKSAVLIATGPTMANYVPIPDAIHFGVNSAFKNPVINLDYWFGIDYTACETFIDDLKQTSFVKFFGQCSSSTSNHIYLKDNMNWNFSDSLIESIPNSYKFYFDHPAKEVNRDIETQSLPDLNSSIFSALYFALYTGVKRIYIVGCDCSLGGYFNQEQTKDCWAKTNVPQKLLFGWNIFTTYLKTFHPDVEIVSINPVGLKGRFKDIYTNDIGKYVDEYGEEICPD